MNFGSSKLKQGAVRSGKYGEVGLTKFEGKNNTSYYKTRYYREGGGKRSSFWQEKQQILKNEHIKSNCFFCEFKF